MRLTTLLLVTVSCLCTANASAASLNPFTWFGSSVSEEDLQPIRVASPEEEVAADRILNKGLSKFSAGSYGGADKQFKKVVKNYPTTESAAEALYMRGRVYMEKKRYVKAYKFLQSTVDTYPNYKDFNRVIGAQFECATALMEGARGRIFGIIPGFKQYGESIKQFEGVISNAPYSDYSPLALMDIALVAEKRNDDEVAIDALDRLINFYPQSMLAPDAYYTLAKTYGGLVQNAEYDQGSTRQAISYYEDYLVLFPESQSVGEVEANLKKMENLLASSRLLLGDFYYFHRSNNTAALVFYNETITIAPDSEAAAEAQNRINDIEAGVRPFTGTNFFKKILFID
ncbi:Tetratricopeptide TPR_2 repeat protein [Coraliomargarita akajimensis DSM 45221]|uniref:Tetratricopeptide TPR_2 repeat protein n=2 Tax=Coraliomargarita TaxID=442430 RepID=D5ERB7_CORAD|nr:Tetratricopeptide TPR_2 repeat protein [Coraliomargarita akajimensis DSM 45221]